MHEYLTETETASLLRISPRTLRNWRWLDKGPEYVKAGNRVLYRRMTVQTWLRNHA